MSRRLVLYIGNLIGLVALFTGKTLGEYGMDGAGAAVAMAGGIFVTWWALRGPSGVVDQRSQSEE